MFLINPRVRTVRVPQTTTRPPSGETPLRVPVPTPYLFYLLCASRRLDLVTAKRVRDVRTAAMPPFC